MKSCPRDGEFDRSTESNDKSPITTTYSYTEDTDHEWGLQLHVIARCIKRNILFDAKNLAAKCET